MSYTFSVQRMIVFVTIVGGLLALYAWHLRDKQSAIADAVQYEKRIEAHANLHSQVRRVFAGISQIDQQLLEFVRQLPEVNRKQSLTFSRSSRASDSAITYTYRLKDKTEVVAFRVLGEYKRDHLEPHVFTVRYSDTANNKAAAIFLEKAIRSQYIFTPDFTLQHEPVEQLPPEF